VTCPRPLKGRTDRTDRTDRSSGRLSFGKRRLDWTGLDWIYKRKLGNWELVTVGYKGTSSMAGLEKGRARTRTRLSKSESEKFTD